MWAASRFCQVGIRPIIKSTVPVLKSTLSVNSHDLLNSTSTVKHQVYRRFTSQKRISHALRRTKVNVDPETPFTLGRGIATGAGLAGLASLCYYGLGIGKHEGILENSVLWPEYVKNRIKTTYMYVGGSIVVSVTAAVAVLRTPSIMRLFVTGGILPNLALLGLLMGTGYVVHSLPYEPGFGAKQISWIAFSSLVGGMMAPLYIVGGPAIIRAAWATAGIVGGLSVVAITAPSQKFLAIAGPLGIGCGLLFASGIGAMFLPPTTLIGASLHSFFIYGGLVLFSLMLLYDTQKTVKVAESLPPNGYGGKKYDPVAMSLSLFMDIVNIFSRLVVILSGSNKR